MEDDKIKEVVERSEELSKVINDTGRATIRQQILSLKEDFDSVNATIMEKSSNLGRHSQ